MKKLNDLKEIKILREDSDYKQGIMRIRFQILLNDDTWHKTSLAVGIEGKTDIDFSNEIYNCEDDLVYVWNMMKKQGYIEYKNWEVDGQVTRHIIANPIKIQTIDGIDLIDDLK